MGDVDYYRLIFDYVVIYVDAGIVIVVVDSNRGTCCSGFELYIVFFYSFLFNAIC